MDNDLERSVRLLEDALATPTKGNTPRRRKIEALKDLSITLNQSELQKLLESQTHSAYDETLNILLNVDKSVTGSVIQAKGPWKSTMENLYVEFAGILQNSSGGIDILETAADLARCCSDALSVIKSLKSKVAVSQIEEEKWLESERNNWRLLYVLYQDRLSTQSVSQQEEEFSPYLGNSEKYCVEHLFKKDNLVRESQLVIDWLERNALDRDDPILHQSDWTCGWEHTIHQLLSPDTIAIGSNTDRIVSCIHPDVPHFEDLSLHHLDAANEKQLCRRIFMEIRCGKLEAAQELCMNCGHPWRAAMLEGWKLYHNPNVKNGNAIEENGENTETAKSHAPMNEYVYRDCEGNMNRDLWKSMAFEYCKKPNLSMHEKASIAALCGYLEPLLPVCTSWEDNLWAYMRTMVDIRVESEIRDSIVRNYIPLMQEYWEQKMSLNEVFAALEASKNAQVRDQSQQPDHILQKLIILDQIPVLISTLEEWIEEPNISAHALRFFAHLVLFFDEVGEICSKKSFEKILEAYIERLSQMNETQLVAFYVSKLSKRKQVDIYAKHLEKILNNEDRKTALNYGEDYSLDVMAVTQRIVENIRSRPVTVENSGNLNARLTEEDELRISAIDWLTFYDIQRSEALTQTNAIIFKFLTLGKLEAAQLAINKIPPDSVDIIMSEGEVSDEVNQIIKEYLSYKSYLDAQEAFNEWFKEFRSKPLPPAPLPDNAQFTEKVAHEHRVAQYNADVKRWKLGTTQSAKTAKTLLYNVLLFPQGWLVGGEDADYLRSICLPEVVLLLYAILSESGQHAEAVQLADLIAAEKHALYKVYSKEKLAEILEKLCESSVALLNAKKDPWGANTST